MPGDDPLGAEQENYRESLPSAYQAAFSAIKLNNVLVIEHIVCYVKQVNIANEFRCCLMVGSDC
jgi:hypothetical protein